MGHVRGDGPDPSDRPPQNPKGTPVADSNWHRDSNWHFADSNWHRDSNWHSRTPTGSFAHRAPSLGVVVDWAPVSRDPRVRTLR